MFVGAVLHPPAALHKDNVANGAKVYDYCHKMLAEREEANSRLYRFRTCDTLIEGYRVSK